LAHTHTMPLFRNGIQHGVHVPAEGPTL
jgi:hypothetical protein